MKTPDISKGIDGQRGFTLIELLVSLTITLVVLSGVVQVLTVSKSNFITGRELAMTQENARYAMRFISDEIRMAGFTGCASKPLGIANTIEGAIGSWYLNNPGVGGFEHEAGLVNFPPEFSADVLANTDALVVRRAVSTGLRTALDQNHVPTAAALHLNKPPGDIRGKALVIATPDCRQVGIFQVTGPAAPPGNPNQLTHNTGNSVSPGNCETGMSGTNAACDSLETPVSDLPYDPGSSIYELHSEAYYIGSSGSVPALFRERMFLDNPGPPAKPTLKTSAEELVKGVENMQIFYGIDTQPAERDGFADKYVKANDSDLNNADNTIVSVRLSLRMRSELPVYTQPVAFDEFEGVAGTDGSDRFMRQDVSTTITVRNF